MQKHNVKPGLQKCKRLRRKVQALRSLIFNIIMFLDMMEELRPALADRFVLRLINKRMVGKTDFIEKEDGAILLTDDARKRVLDEWQKRKQEQIIHPYLKEKIQWGMVPYMQAMFLARYLRGDIDAYPPFLWK